MITLNTTTRKLQAVLSGAVSTNQLPIVTSYADKTTSAYTGGANRTTTNNTTQVDIVAAPAASTIREVDFISVFNKDTATRTVTILYDDNGTDAELITAVLLVGETLQYTHANGWKVLDSAGAVKTTANTVPTTSAALAAQITDETGTGELVFGTNPVLVTPNIGTPSAGTLTNCTGLPISTGVSGLGTGVATFLATPSSANLASAVTDETGSGSLVFATGAAINPSSIGATTPGSGAFTTLSTTGNVTLGDASGDTLTINASTVSIPNGLNFDSNTLVIDAANNRVGVRTASPSVPLDIVFGGNSLLVGADNGLSTRTNATLKVGRITSPHYTNTENPFVIFSGLSDATNNYVEVGTNTSSLNAATRISFFTSSSNTGSVLATERMRITGGGNVLIGTTTDNGTDRIQNNGGYTGTGRIVSTSQTAGIGYATGAGGTVTQATSKSTGVTLNRVCGQITMNGESLASNTAVSFTLTNSAIATTDAVICHRNSVGTANAYRVEVDSVAAGSCVIRVTNVTAGSLSEAIVLTFAVIKAVTA